jgi:hypothetical protein
MVRDLMRNIIADEIRLFSIHCRLTLTLWAATLDTLATPADQDQAAHQCRV